LKVPQRPAMDFIYMLLDIVVNGLAVLRPQIGAGRILLTENELSVTRSSLYHSAPTINM